MCSSSKKAIVSFRNSIRKSWEDLLYIKKYELRDKDYEARKKKSQELLKIMKLLWNVMIILWENEEK